MADDIDPVEIRLTASDAGATAAIDRMIARLESVVPAGKGAADSLDGVTDATKGAAEAASELSDATQTATDSLDRMSAAERRAEEAGRKFDAMSHTITVSGIFDEAAASAAGAEKEIKKAGETLKTSFSKTAGLATDPAAFFKQGTGGATLLGREAVKAANEIGKIEVPVQRLGRTMLGLPTIERALGLGRLPMINADLRVMAGIFGDLGVAGLGVVGLSALVLAAGAATIGQAIHLEEATHENASANSGKLLDEINKRLNDAEKTGTLSPEKLRAFNQEIKSLIASQEKANELTRFHPAFDPDAGLGLGKAPDALLGPLHIPYNLDVAANLMPDWVKRQASNMAGMGDKQTTDQGAIQKRMSGLLGDMTKSQKPGFAEEEQALMAHVQIQEQMVKDSEDHKVALAKNAHESLMSNNDVLWKEEIASLENVTQTELDANFRKYKAEDAVRKQALANLEKDLERQKDDIEKAAHTRLEIEKNKALGTSMNNRSTSQAENINSRGASQVSRVQQNDPGFVKQLTTNVRNLAQEWSLVGKNMANALTNVATAGVSTLSKGLTGLIFNTMTLGQVAIQMGEMFVESIIQVALQWVASQLMMFLFGNSLRAAAMATTAAEAVTTAGLWATPATLATIATFGGAAVAAPGEIGIAQGLVQGMSVFADGGYTGPGGKWDVAGVVHRGEYVLTKSQVESIGLANVAAFAAGYEPGTPVPVPQAQHQSGYAGGGLVGGMPKLQPGPVNIVMAGSRQQTRDMMIKEGARIVNADNAKRGNRVNA